MTSHLPPSLLRSENERAVSRLSEYYSAGNPYTGVTFDTWHSRHCAPAPTEFTADDILAVTFLSVTVPPAATRQLLAGEFNRFNFLLAQIPPDLCFWEASAPDRASAQWQLEDALREFYSIDLAIASKLMARKRPHLVPINDKLVRDLLGLRHSFWGSLFVAFSDSRLKSRLASIRDEAGSRDDVAMPQGLSLLRVFDVITWMDGKAGTAEPRKQDGGPLPHDNTNETHP